MEQGRPSEAGVQAQAAHHAASPGLPLTPVDTQGAVPLLTCPLARRELAGSQNTQFPVPLCLPGPCLFLEKLPRRQDTAE